MHITADMSDTVEALERRRLVVTHDHHGQVYIALTQEALTRGLVRISSLDSPTGALHSRPDIALEDKTSYELICALTSQGWTWISVCSGITLSSPHPMDASDA